MTRVLRIALALVVLALALVARRAEAQFLSPGPLSKAHTQLEGDAHCNDCHSGGKRVEAGGCLKCHSNLGARINAGQGLHGLQYRGKPCESCHVEHLGVATSLTRWPGGNPSKLDHAQTGWPLEGAHRIPCAKCHNKPNSRGNPTYLGNSKTCTSCHKDQHDGRFGTTCTNCHDSVSWKSLRLNDFNHDLARFPLRESHKTVACVKCHSEPPKYVGLAFEKCTDCHKDPHAGRFGASCTNCHNETKWSPVSFQRAGMQHPGVSLANGHAQVACRTCHDKGNTVAPSKGSECVSCHKPVHEAPFGRACVQCHASIQWLGLPRAVGLASHARTPYPLDGKHVDVACARCHRPDRPEDQRYRRLAFGRCADCHRDEHRGEFAALNRGECKGCHATSGFRPTLFSVDAHASTKFPLQGKHVASPCSSCHTASRPRLDLHVPKQACADCHANPHGDQFATEMAQGGCAQCHNPRGWNLPKIDHRTWPLTGAHADAQCDSCHHPTAQDRKAGRGASYRGVPRDCTGCHDDAHLGQFRLSQPIFECEQCHSTTNFKIPKFDHAAKTSWALTGAHEKTACNKCHLMATPTTGERAVPRYRGVGTDCKFCHANPHLQRETGKRAEWSPPDGALRGAFADVPRAVLVFAFALDAEPTPPVTPPTASATASARAAGSSSPPPRPAPSARPASSPAAGAGGLSDNMPCEACHTTTAWRTTSGAAGAVKFNHSTTGFPLTGQHIHAACVSCHKSAESPKRACASCHEDLHRGRLLQTCDSCHVPAGWRVTQPFDIHRRTRFPLTGMHTLADCSQCHLRANEQRFTDAPVACFGCHEQDYRRPTNFPLHAGTATTPALPRDCSICHRATAWVPANVPAGLVASVRSPLQTQPAPPNHNLRFPLSFGSHRTAACSDCHTSLGAPRAVRCIGCHAHDPVVLRQQHRQAIAMDGPSCMSCHPGGARR